MARLVNEISAHDPLHPSYNHSHHKHFLAAGFQRVGVATIGKGHLASHYRSPNHGDIKADLQSGSWHHVSADLEGKTKEGLMHYLNFLKFER